jgi:hypothetical protein
MSNLRVDGNWTQTFCRLKFYGIDPRPEDIDIRDVAHAEANMNRYNGHTPEPYSVAQHSYYVSLMVPEEDALWGLLHDGSEAYVADIVSPVKRHLPDYMRVEDKIMSVICRKFWLNPQMPDSVKEADLRVLANEVNVFFPEAERPGDWRLPLPPYKNLVVRPYDNWRTAESIFLRRFEELWPAHIARVKAQIAALE